MSKKLTVKEKFIKYINEHGYPSVLSLANACGINSANLFTNLNSQWGMSVKRAFIIANTMGVPVEEILYIFYEDEYKENARAIKKKAR